MPRPKKPRHCGCNMQGQAFKPSGTPLSRLEHISLEQDELEALKLGDYDGLTQEEAGQKMGVSRGTVQRLLNSARKKVARALFARAALILK
ncbi:MAG: DUF134 domain-containing protein [Desulfobulbaceae bacterium]|nr:DUF134 domain-containing protein [Desulfobulbaceae bacterium]HIJ79209.1 DUF134 domain-containing protein [Deltaproteobacteria bacterium]